MSTATTIAPTPRKRTKGYEPDALNHMLVEMFRRNRHMPAAVRAAAQERARAAYDAEPIDQEALWALLEELRAAAPSWDPPAPQRAPGVPMVVPDRAANATNRAPVAPERAPAASVALSLFGDPLPAPVTAPTASAPAPVPSAATPAAEPAGLEAASRSQFQALGQVRRCPICARGLIPAPPAERRCDRCGAVVVVPQYTDVPRDFLRWLELQVAGRQMPAYLTRQGVFERWVGNLYHGTTWGEGAERRQITHVAPVGDCYALALIDYQRWVASGSPTDLWTVTL